MDRESGSRKERHVLTVDANILFVDDKELSFRKIAEIFGRTESWARITFHRAKVRIISEMEDGNGKDET